MAVIRRTPRLVRFVLPIACVVFVAGCGGGGSSGGEVVSTASSTGDAAPAAATGAVADRSRAAVQGLLVDVAGAVRRPGVYELAEGSRVHDAIAAAGGARAGARLDAVNRAAPLVDGQQVLVPAQVASTGGGGAAAGPAAATVSINAADADGLDGLPGIGPVTAANIVADRTANGPFASVDDLARVPGIGPSTVEALRDAATT